jgi:hypothetical protein
MIIRIISFILCVAVLISILPNAFPIPAEASGTTYITIKKLASDGTVLSETTIDWQTMKNTKHIEGDGSTHYFLQGFTGDSDNLWDKEEMISTKDMGALMGTDVKELCHLVGDMSASDTVEIKNANGSKKVFDYVNVYFPSARQGKLVICWYCNNPSTEVGHGGGYVPAWSDGMKLVFFAEDLNSQSLHEFGIWDMHETFPENRWVYHSYNGILYPTTLDLSVNHVSQITIYSSQPRSTPPGAPLNLRVTGVSIGSVGLAWDVPSSNGGSAITGYKVSCRTSAGNGTLNGNATGTTFSDTTAVAGTTYFYRVKALNAAGESDFSNEVTASIPLPAPMISSPGNADSAGGMVIDTLKPVMLWNAVSGASYYIVKISHYPYGLNNLVYTSQAIYSNTLTLSAGVLVAGERYSWQVQAFNESGGSLDSNTLYFQTPAPAPTATWTVPSPPQDLRQTAVSPAQVSLAWNIPNTDGGTPVTGYKIYRSSTSNKEVYYADAAGLFFNDAGVTGGASYYYKVKAVNASGSSQFSNELSISTPTAVTTTPSPSITPLVTSTPASKPTTSSTIASAQTTPSPAATTRVSTPIQASTTTPAMTTSSPVSTTASTPTTSRPLSSATAASSAAPVTSTPAGLANSTSLSNVTPAGTYSGGPSSAVSTGSSSPGAAVQENSSALLKIILISIIAGLAVLALAVEIIFRYRRKP